MRSVKNYLMAALFVMLATLCVSANSAWAEQEKAAVGFSVKAVQSDKQVDKKVSYFDLMLSPNEEHVLEVDIFNTSDETLNASVTANTAGTNSGGVIEYTAANVTDDSLQASFERLTNVETPLVSVPANDSVRVAIKLKMPEEAFDGVMLGGIAIKKSEDESKLQEENGTRIQNEYCYIIGVKIRENDTEIEPDFRLRHVAPTLTNYHTSIAANLQNFMPAIVKGLEISADVYYNNETEPLYTSTHASFDVAPNSNFDYIIPCDGRLAPGDYRLHLTAALKEKIWEFDETFTVSGADANEVNEQAVNVPPVNYYKIATFCLLILLIAILIFFAAKKMRDRKDRYDKK